MKKKIFIFNYFMYIGGAERALLGLLNAIDYTKYDVDLFLAMHVGEFMKLIPKEANLLPEDSRYAGYASPLKNVLFSKDFVIGLARLNAKRKFKNYLKQNRLNHSEAGFQYAVKEMLPYLSKINPSIEYDLAISFIAPHNIVAEKVRAKKKIAWIHTDYTKIDVNVGMELSVWNKFDYIASISEEAGKRFSKVFPSLQPKLFQIENILSPSFIREQSELEDVIKEMPKEESVINLLSIGRFCEAKNYDNVPDICRQVLSHLSSLNTNLSIKWFIIGGGSDENLIRNRIRENGMEDNVILLGVKTNPYPYIKSCDVYVQPSRYEGKSVTVKEAQVLCKPVIVTNYPTASSQIRTGIDGIIVPMDNEGCAKGIVEVISDKILQRRLIKYLQTHDYGNETEVDKIYKLIN